ncbi:2-oxoacid:acceptor oxidoreductase subunit alpha [Chloroflexota bacterium]
MAVDLNFMVGGEAGQGVQSVGFMLAKTLARGGYHVFADQDYESRVRGGHNFFRIRVKDSPVGAIAEGVDVLIALDRESLDRHYKELSGGGVIVFDGEKMSDVRSGGSRFGVPLESLAREKAGNKLMANTVALGAVLGLAGYGLEILEGVLRERFAGEIGGGNVRAARAGYEYAEQNFKGNFGGLIVPVGGDMRMLLSGNEAIALGAIAAGCTFMAGYPMTPASSIMEYLAAKAKDRVVVVHTEDEIAAMNMIIGASFAGARAMTATSGSGFCLMVEGLGLAGITETPVVVIDAQRPGPATGLPTRTEQSDLEFVLYASHGEFPRAVLAPATVEDCFYLTARAFNLADRYQLPVILLTDQHLASSYSTVERFDLSRVSIDRGLLFKRRGAAEYKRHRITSSGVSPRAFPGREGVLVATDADEHNEAGHLIEDAATRTQMVEKRMRKLCGLRQEMTPPRRYGPKSAEITLVGWGSTYGALVEAADILHRDGVKLNLLHLNELWPFPAGAVDEALGNARSSYVVENNATGQLAHLIGAETGRKVSGGILKFDGRPFTPAYIARRVKEEGGASHAG